MKYLKYLLYLILLLLLMFFGMGLITPEVKYECDITVDKSAKEAWAVMSDETKVAGWIEGYLRTEMVSGTPNTVGAVSNVFINNSGEEMSMEETITSFVPVKQMAMTFTMDFMDMDYDMKLEEQGGKTKITTTSNTKGNSLFTKSMLAFMPSGMKAQEEKNLNNLKRIINENTTDYFPAPVFEAEVPAEIEEDSVSEK